MFQCQYLFIFFIIIFFQCKCFNTNVKIFKNKNPFNANVYMALFWVHIKSVVKEPEVTQLDTMVTQCWHSYSEGPGLD